MKFIKKVKHGLIGVSIISAVTLLTYTFYSYTDHAFLLTFVIICFIPPVFAFKDVIKHGAVDKISRKMVFGVISILIIAFNLYTLTLLVGPLLPEATAKSGEYRSLFGGQAQWASKAKLDSIDKLAELHKQDYLKKRLEIKNFFKRQMSDSAWISCVQKELSFDKVPPQYIIKLYKEKKSVQDYEDFMKSISKYNFSEHVTRQEAYRIKMNRKYMIYEKLDYSIHIEKEKDPIIVALSAYILAGLLEGLILVILFLIIEMALDN